MALIAARFTRASRSRYARVIGGRSMHVAGRMAGAARLAISREPHSLPDLRDPCVESIFVSFVIFVIFVVR
jgi:hypothetical protein